MKYLPLLCLLPWVAAAAPPNPGKDVNQDTGLDATVLRSRVKLSNEYVDREFGSSENTTTLNFSYAFGMVEQCDWSLQLDLPMVNYRAGATGPPGDASGFGDIETRVLHIMNAEGLYRWALGVEALFDTASEPPLGDGIFSLSAGYALAVQPCRSFKFQASAQFEQSLETAAGVSEVQKLKLKPAVQFDLPGGFYGYLETELGWNIHADGEFGSKFKVEAGRGFGKRKEWVANLRYETPLTESANQNIVTAGLAYVFR